MACDTQAGAPRGEDAGASARLCEAIGRWRYETLPDPVVSAVKRFLLDTFGVIGGAADAPGIAATHARAARWETSGSATALLGKRACSPPTAAFVNGAVAHALDYDDLHDGARVHTNCVLLPAVLATAEDVGAVSGGDFVLAMAIGAEVHARLGLACPSQLATGWHPTMVLGTLAAALAAGVLRKLDAEQLNHALGIALHQACGTVQVIHDGVLAKRLGAGFAARNAVWAAALAADGLTGPHRSLEGDAGLYALFERNQGDPTRLFARLGEHWEVPGYSFKPYPCCRCMHTVISLGVDLRARGVDADGVESATVGMGDVNAQIVGGPYDPGHDSVVHAQFNAAYGFARALRDGHVGLAAFRRPAIGDPAVAALARRVRVVSDPAIAPNAIEPARITVTMRDGRIHTIGSDVMKGSPQAPMSDREFDTKFRECLALGLGAPPADIARLAHAIDTIEGSQDAARDLVAAFPAQKERSGTWQ